MPGRDPNRNQTTPKPVPTAITAGGPRPTTQTGTERNAGTRGVAPPGQRWRYPATTRTPTGRTRPSPPPSPLEVLATTRTRTGRTAGRPCGHHRQEVPAARPEPQPTGTRAPRGSPPRPAYEHPLSALSADRVPRCGGGGNRTRVLRRFDRASPGAARGVSTRPHRSSEQAGVTGPAAVSCPSVTRDRSPR